MPTSRSLDHFVICVGDIETAAEAWRRLGFRVMPVMQHVNIGTSNVIVQFEDTYLELIGDFDYCHLAPLIDRMQPWLALDEDVYWQTSITSRRLEDELEPLRAKGLTPQPINSAARRVRLTEGGWDETDSRSFYTFNEHDIHASLFMSDHRKPEAIWMPGWQCHPNTTRRVLGISYLAEDVARVANYMSLMFGAEPDEKAPDRIAFRTPRGEFLEICDQAAGRVPGSQPLQAGVGARGAAFTIGVDSVERCRWALRDGGVPHRQLDQGLVVPASHGCGMALHFREV
jgi:hypothetical protein